MDRWAREVERARRLVCEALCLKGRLVSGGDLMVAAHIRTYEQAWAILDALVAEGLLRRYPTEGWMPDQLYERVQTT